MFIRSGLCLAVCVWLGFGCPGDAEKKALPAPRIGELTEVFGSANAIDTVNNATRITAYRLRRNDPAFDADKKTLDEAAVAGDAVEVSPEAAKELRDALLNPMSYGWTRNKLCWPSYGVRIRFATEQQKTDVLLCFDCSMLKIYENGNWFDGEEDFDAGHSQLVTAVKRIFPNDKTIQTISMDPNGPPAIDNDPPPRR